MRSEKTGRPQPTAPTSTPGLSHLLSLPFFGGFFSYTCIHEEKWRGNTEASEKENTLKASMGVKGSEQRMTSVMEIRVGRRSNTGGSLLWILLNGTDSPTHWVQYPASHEHTQLDPHTHASLILMPTPPTRAHNACHANVLLPIQTQLCSYTYSWRKKTWMCMTEWGNRTCLDMQIF